MRDSIIIAVAGHVKHGKTSLTKLLTGMELNRHPEEQRRGLTITAGHAVLRLPDGKTAFFIDLPGHKEFLHNAIRGLWGIDAAILVIAADEGVMPQTREHLLLLGILGVPRLIVVLTKTDRIDSELLMMAMEETKDILARSAYKNAPIIQVSSVSQTGKERLIKAIEQLFPTLPTPELDQPFVMAIDHVLHKEGMGTVVTGSVTSGSLRVGDTIEIYPQGIHDNVRSIQAGGRPQDMAKEGMRVGLNLAKTRLSEVKAGDVIGPPSTLPQGRFLNVELYAATHAKTEDFIKPIGTNTTVKLFAGTQTLICKLILIDKDELLPGEKGLAQLRLSSPMAILPFSPFVILSLSSQTILGGGRILEISERKWRQRWSANGSLLNTLARGDLKDVIPALFASKPLHIFKINELAMASGYPERIVRNTLAELKSTSKAIEIGDGFYSKSRFEEIQRNILETVQQYHLVNPNHHGIPLETLRTRFGELPHNLFEFSLSHLIAKNKLKKHEHYISLAEFKQKLTKNIETVMQAVLSMAEKSWIMPITFHSALMELKASQKDMREALRQLTKQGDLIRIYKSKNGEREEYITPNALTYIKNKLIEYFQHNQQLTIEDAKNLFPLGRRIINILDYLDSISFTLLDKRNMVRILYPHFKINLQDKSNNPASFTINQTTSSKELKANEDVNNIPKIN